MVITAMNGRQYSGRGTGDRILIDLEGFQATGLLMVIQAQKAVLLEILLKGIEKVKATDRGITGLHV